MSNESTIRLLKNKLQIYKVSYSRDVARGNTEAAEKWKDSYRSIVQRIHELQEN